MQNQVIPPRPPPPPYHTSNMNVDILWAKRLKKERKRERVLMRQFVLIVLK